MRGQRLAARFFHRSAKILRRLSLSTSVSTGTDTSPSLSSLQAASLLLSSMSCRSSNPSALALPSTSTWSCDSCHYVNSVKENECGNCPSLKPDPYAFRRTTTSTRPTRTPQPASSPIPATRRLLRSSAGAAALSTASDRAPRKRYVSAPSASIVEEEVEQENDDTELAAEGNACDSDDEALQQRCTHRPKRHCTQQTQQRLHKYYKTTKPNNTATTAPHSPYSAKRQPIADDCHTNQHKPLPPLAQSKAVEQPPAAMVSVPAAFVPPPLATIPFVPATRDETITLLNRVHATLALSAFPTSTTALLPSRTVHLSHLCTFLSRHLVDRTAGAVYIAGRPGVGKTLTVDWALQTTFGPSAAVLGSSKDGVAGGGGSGKVWRYSGKGKGQAGGVRLPATTVVTANAIAMMKGHGSFWCKLLALLSSSRHSSSRHYDDPLHLSADEALQRIHQLVENTRHRGEMIVLVLDEIDALLSSASSTPAAGSSAGASGGSFTLLHALFRLVYGASSCVVLLSISNSITLLDSHCATLAASNSLPERVVFSTYSQADLLSILQERLLRCLPSSTTPSSLSTPTADISPAPVALPFFAPAALDFICKATSKDTGDIRRCLRDCRHAIQQLLTTCTTAPASAAFSPASCQLTVSSLARVKAEREAATQHGRLTELSVQQLHVLWVLVLVGGVVVGRAGECYRRCASRVRCGLTELSGSEVCAVLDMLESEGMVRKDKQGKAVRYVSVVTVERMRRQLRGDVWDTLWSKANIIQRKA